MNRKLLPAAVASMLGMPDAFPERDPESRDCVILLHGIMRTARSMRILEWALTGRGYRVINNGYPSRDALIEDLAEEALGAALQACADAPRVHFVAHSMGCILLRQWAAHHALPRAGRAVMLGPPNAGSAIVDRFRDWKLFSMISGPAGAQLGTGPDSLPGKLPASAPIEVGIIAGNRTLNPISSALLDGPDDGKVSVASAFAMSAKEEIVLPVSHTWMPASPQVISATARFLESGSFRPKPPPPG